MLAMIWTIIKILLAILAIVVLIDSFFQYNHNIAGTLLGIFIVICLLGMSLDDPGPTSYP